ncbi:MAG TPA: DUF4019 domain-containing protein [Desulfuromonadales bacterium]|nr:DUF4019 domain-containing protein [Desulfuromonadales bacterium]
MIFRDFRIHLMLLAVCLFLIIVPAINKTPSQEVADQAMAAANQFLLLVDTEEYVRSWEVSSSALKNILSRAAWKDQIAELRAFLGPILDREARDISYTRHARDIPAGEYVVLTFLSRFGNRPVATETVTLKLGADAAWRVAGYFIRYGDPPARA